MTRAGASHAQYQLMAISRRTRQGKTQPIHRPTTETKVTLEHSKQLVRVAITATISTIVWVRKCFGSNYRWTYRSCDPADPTFTYATYKDGLEPPSDVDITPGLYQWPIITSGQQQAADKLLSWLEGGVRDAVERGVLSKLQLNFHTSEGVVSPSNIVESYTMAFTYENGDISQLIGTEFTAPREADSPMLVHNANTQMINLVNSVCERVRCFDKCRKSSSETLGRRLTMRLEFNDTCPPGYRPDSFCPSRDQTGGINSTGTNDKSLTMQSDFHQVSVQLPTPDPTQNHGQIPRSPRTNDQRGKGLTGVGDISDNISNSNSEAGSFGSDNDFQSPDNSSTQAEEIHTQPEVMSMLEKIGVSRDPNNGTQDTILLSKRRLLSFRASSAAVHAATPSEANVPNRRYATHICERLDKAHVHRVGLSDYDLDEPSKTQPEVTCECGASTDRENLMQCDLCGSFQHMQCYGYYKPKAQQAESVCYTCLGKDEEVTSPGIDTLCIQRRIIYYLLIVGGKTAAEVARYINREVQFVETLFQDLEDEGFIQQRPPNKRLRTKRKAANIKYDVVTSEPQHWKEIFDPDLGIAHHLNLSDTFVGGHQVASLGLSTEPSVQQLDETWASRKARNNVLLAGSSTQGTPSPRVSRSSVRNPTASRSHSPEFRGPGASQEETTSTGRKRSHEASLNSGRRFVRFWDARSPQVAHTMN